MEYVIGAGLALAVGAFAILVGFERDRAFYPAVLIVVASLYILFAAIGGSATAMGLELPAMALFVTLAVIGFRKNLWLVALALAGHGLFDLVHGHLIENPGVPAWWPAFCMSYDIAAGAWFAWRLWTTRQAVRSGPVRNSGPAGAWSGR